jgi:NADPH:quinone reductase-like Zn-dependent oxidoreductase
MRAWVYPSINGKIEDSISFEESVPVPDRSSLAKDQLLIKVISAALNPVDYKLPESGYAGSIMITKPATPGIDYCGRVIGKHPSNNAFEEGQVVFGSFSRTPKLGTLAEYTVISSAECARLPVGIDHDHAAAVGTAATTALQSLPATVVKPGAKIFINGGTGGVGSWGIQFAKAMGAEITTSCSTGNIELCRQLGADYVIDYRKQDVLKSVKAMGRVFDLFVDNVGDNPAMYKSCSEFLKPGGSYIQVGVGGSVTMAGIASSFKKTLLSHLGLNGGILFQFIHANNATEYLTQIGQWIVEGKAKAVIDKIFSLEQVPDAFRLLREGHVRGKLVIRVAGA